MSSSSSSSGGTVVMGALVYYACYDIGSLPACSGNLCSNAVEITLKSILCPSDEWLGDGQYDTTTCTGLRIEYEAGQGTCGVDLYCGADVPYVAGTDHVLSVTRQRRFRVVAVDTLGNVHQPDLGNAARYAPDPDPRYQGFPQTSRCPVLVNGSLGVYHQIDN